MKKLATSTALGLWLLAGATAATAKPPAPAGRIYFATALGLPDPFGLDSASPAFPRAFATSAARWMSEAV